MALDKVIFQATYNKIQLPSFIEDDILNIGREITGVDGEASKYPTIKITQNTQAETEYEYMWFFNGAKIQVAIRGEQIQIISNGYEGHEVFHPIIDRIFGALIRLYPLTVNRFSIRYINLFSIPDGDPFDFSGVIINELSAPTQAFKGDGLTRSLGNISINKNDVNVTFIFGHYNSEFPNKISRREFVLDYDCSISTLPNPIQISTHLTSIRKVANGLYEKSINHA